MADGPPGDLAFRALGPFLAVAFGLTWGIAALLLLLPGRLEALFGPVSGTNPLFILAVYAPAIAAALLILRRAGLKGLGRFLARLTLWRMPLGWWVVLVLGIPAVFYLGAALKTAMGATVPPVPPFSLGAALTALVIGPIEEFGWRGVALPLLQRRMAPLQAALVLGVIWGLWHIPAFLLSGAPQAAWSFPAFLVGVVAMSVIMTAMFNAAGGSLLVPALLHFQANNPSWPDAQPWDAPVIALLAAAVVWVARRPLLHREAASTTVIPPPAEPTPVTNQGQV